MPGPGEEKPKLYYFNGKGKNYPIKVLFACGNVDFEDVKFDPSEFSKYKKEMPMGQVPFVEYKKQKLCQSVACAEFAAEMSGLTPKDAWQKSKVTEMIFSCDDVYQKCRETYMKEASVKKEGRQKACKESFPMYFQGIDKMIGDNSNPGFCVGSKLTAADVFVFCMVDQFKCGQFEFVPTDVFDSYTNITKVYETMMKHPKVKECKDCIDKCPVHTL